MRKISVDLHKLISIYCDLHNLMVKADPTWFEQKVLKREVKDELNKRLMFIKSKLIQQMEAGMQKKLHLPVEQNIFKAEYDEIIKKIGEYHGKQQH